MTVSQEKNLVLLGFTSAGSIPSSSSAPTGLTGPSTHLSTGVQLNVCLLEDLPDPRQKAPACGHTRAGKGGRMWTCADSVL